MTASDDAPREPRLLSGGNPQVPKGDGDEPVRAYLAAMPGWKQDVGRRLDELVATAVPDVVKAVRWNQPLYGRADDGFFTSFRCFTAYVKLTFFAGARLEPVPPQRFKDPDARALHLHEGDPLDETQLVAWFRQAAELPGWTP